MQGAGSQLHLMSPNFTETCCSLLVPFIHKSNGKWGTDSRHKMEQRYKLPLSARLQWIAVPLATLQLSRRDEIQHHGGVAALHTRQPDLNSPHLQLKWFKGVKLERPTSHFLQSNFQWSHHRHICLAPIITLSCSWRHLMKVMIFNPPFHSC